MAAKSGVPPPQKGQPLGKEAEKAADAAPGPPAEGHSLLRQVLRRVLEFRTVKSHLHLEYSEVSLKDLGEGGVLVIKSCAATVKCARWEAAGRAFHELALALAGHEAAVEADEPAEGPSPSKGEEAAVDPTAWESSRRAKKPGKKGEEEQQQQDHYALLGLAHLRYLATEDQIRKSYRDAALRFHPDKQAAMLLEAETEEAKEALKEEIESKFKAIQLAYEVLMDPSKRRVFDSTDEFDDDIPGDCAPESFFKVYGPAFQRNAKWSLVVPEGGVPLLGDDDTSMENVDKFYDFWWGFKSWREFPSEDEFDLESAEGREHRRWMERQNSKMREKAKKEENIRIRQLVENAWKRDPRLARRKEEEKREKQRRKEEKHKEKFLKEEQERKAAEEERQRREEEERRLAEEAAALKKQKEKEKKLVRKERARLRTVAAPCISPAAAAAVPYSQERKLPEGRGWPVLEDDVEKLCMSLEIERLKCLCEQLESTEDVGVRTGALRHWLRALHRDCWDGNQPGFPADVHDVDTVPQPEPPTPAANGVKEHTSEQGPADSGAKASTLTKSGSNKAQKSSGAGASAADTKPWSKQEVDLLRKAVNKFPKGTAQRWEVIAGYLKTGRTAEEIVKGVKTLLLQKPDDSAAFDSFLQKRKAPKDIVSPLSTRDDAANGSSSGGLANGEVSSEDKPETGAGAQGASSTPSAETASSGGSATAADAWSEAQEVALVKAIKAFPKETDKRWERIAAAVPGKTKTQCFKKFQELRETFRTKKAETGGTAE